MDTVTTDKRSWLMSRVRSHGNQSTEIRLILLFRAEGIKGWRRNYPLFGRPDFVFPKARVVVFVDGCFWHGHPTRCRLPESHREYWQNKINRNLARDRKVTRYLRKKGWKVVRIWESSINKTSTLKRMQKVLS
jgi:DNA mismatch endonuclease (patch repair protein)